jgi:hypothetical protein
VAPAAGRRAGDGVGRDGRPTAEPFGLVGRHQPGSPIAVAAAGFLSLYLPSGEISIRSVSWIIALTLIAFLLFLLLLSVRNLPVDFSQGAYMTLKAAVIAAVYTQVLVGGLLFTAFAVESLLYPAMDEKIYLTLLVWSLFVGYIFSRLFP